LLFTFGIQIENSWEVLRIAFWGTLGFAVGNYIARVVASLLPPTEISALMGYALWGLIGGAILEAPSRDSRRILISAGICSIGLLIGSYVALDILPRISPVRYSMPKQVLLGTGLGLAFGLLIRRVSAITVLVILGAGIYMITGVVSIKFFSNINMNVWGDIVRGALIGLALGYGYGYLHRAKPPQRELGIAITKLF
jgi:hypothetical protein